MKRIIFILVLAFASAAHAQWSSDPAVNLSICDGSSNAGSPKIVPTADGGCYISWFQMGTDGMELRAQKLDAKGYEAFPHNGVHVANTGITWTQDYGLDVDAIGNALLACVVDDGGRTRILASKVSPQGVLVWGESGIQLGDTSSSVATPEVVGTSDGGAVIAWSQGETTRLQKLDAAGVALWGDGVQLVPDYGSYRVMEMHGSGTDCTLSMAWCTSNCLEGPIYLLAQKFDPFGAPVWGERPLTLFDAGSLPTVSYSDFTLDGSGGALFSWEAFAPALQCFVQHVLADGTEAFPHNGVAVSTNASRIRAYPSAAFDPRTEESFVFWREMNREQSMWGLYGQRIDAKGNRLWADDGLVIEPVGYEEMTVVRCLIDCSDPWVFWNRSPSYQQDRLWGARLSSTGDFEIQPFSMASTPSRKGRPDAVRGKAGFALLAWGDSRNDYGDILAQNVNPDGTLGPRVTDVGGGKAPVPGIALGAPWPNPTSGLVRFEYSAPFRGEIAIKIFDVRGALVRAFHPGDGPRSASIAWDTRDHAGAKVASGIYFAQLRNGGAIHTARIVIIR